jgi:hypothetical protein
VVIRAIVDAVRAECDRSDRDWLTLYSGQPGVALLLAMTARVTGDAELADRARERIADIAAGAMANPNDFFFMSGLTGVVWTIEQVAHLLGDEEDDDPHEAIDEAVAELLVSRKLRFELMKGVAGLGLYALERGPRPSAIRCVELAVEALAASAERTSAGATWFMPIAQLPPSELALFPNGCHSLGTVHGVLGPIAVLAGACERGIATATAGPLLDEAVAWLWDQRRRDPKDGGWFAIAMERPDLATTQGWCYGDPGTAAVLFSAGRAVGRAEWQAFGLELAREVIRRPPTPAMDPMMCHGTTGVAHILNRLSQSDTGLRAGAMAWFARALDQHVEGSGIGGLAALEFENGQRVAKPYVGLVEGSSGAALALLAAVSDVEPRWDHAFVLGHGV